MEICRTPMSWDLIWEPNTWVFRSNVKRMYGWDKDPNYRQRWDKDWEKWINERYGNFANAENDWKVKVPRTPENKVASPSDERFREDGKWRIMVAAYRRFQADMMNRHWNDACRKLRQMDPNHLISYRQGNLPATDFTLISTFKHVDWFNMEGYSFRPEQNGKNKVGFVNRYLTYILQDKPFMWNEYGYGGPRGVIDRELDYNPDFIEYQREYVEMVNSEAYKNGAVGIAPWWFAGGFRNDEKTDFGITTPEGTLRPSGESMKKYGDLYRTSPPSRPVPDKWMTIDLDAHSGGLSYLTSNEGADAYEKASDEGITLGIKTEASGTTSADVPLLAVGNTKYNGKNPPKYLNAEFNWLKIKTGESEWKEFSNGSIVNVPADLPVHIMVSVGNLQEAKWLTLENCKGKPGAVFLASTTKSELEIKKAIDKDTPWQHDTDFGGRFLLSDGISKETAVELQMTAEGRAWFGEKLNFKLMPSDN